MFEKNQYPRILASKAVFCKSFEERIKHRLLVFNPFADSPSGSK
jgi:hypothetical protein